MTRGALVGLTACLLAATAAYGTAFLPGGAPAWAGPVLAVAAAGAMTAVALLAVGRRGWSPLAGILAVGGPVLAWALAVTWLIPGVEATGDALVWGLPPRATHLLYGVGLVPAILVPLVYAFTFDRETLSADALARFRAEAARLRDGDARPSAEPGTREAPPPDAPDPGAP